MCLARAKTWGVDPRLFTAPGSAFGAIPIVILCGDFNDTPLSYAYNTISTNLKDAFKESGQGIGQSFVKLPALRIDYILHNESFKSYNYTKHKQELSDHYAVSCEMEIKR